MLTPRPYARNPRYRAALASWDPTGPSVTESERHLIHVTFDRTTLLEPSVHRAEYSYKYCVIRQGDNMSDMMSDKDNPQRRRRDR